MPSYTRRPSTGRRRRDDAQALVLAAVEAELAAGASYTELGVQRIADAAGIARSTFYTHFRDKNELLIRLGEAASDGLFDVAAAWVAGADAGGGARLEGVVVGMLVHYRRHAPALAALEEVAAYEPEIAAFWRRRVEAFADEVARRAAEGQREGWVPADVDVVETARILAWSVERSVARHVAGDDGSGDARFAAALARVGWLALTGR